MCYDDTEIWISFIKYQHGRLGGPRICAFSSYGSPSTGTLEYMVGSPLAELGTQHRVFGLSDQNYPAHQRYLCSILKLNSMTCSGYVTIIAAA